jgi:sugar phosphate isomerase/epimerase
VSAPHVHIPYHRAVDYLPFIKGNRLNLEIYFPSSSLDSLHPGDIERLKEMLDHRPSLSIHAPFMDMSPGAVDEKVRAVTIERFSHILEIAGILSPEAVVFHSGYEKWRYAHRVDIWLEGSLLTWKPMIEKAARLGIKIAIENIFEDEPHNLHSLMKELHSEHFGICFDTGHCNLFSKVPLEDWLKSLGPYLFELHLHDNDKSSDQHLPIGDGTFDFKALFSLLKGKECLHTIEAHNPENVMKSMQKLKEYTKASPSDP